MPAMDLAKLNELYDHGEQLDKELYSRMRSNVLLSAGEHYNSRYGARKYQNTRETNKVNNTNKLRLVKNYIYRVVKTYTNSIVEKVPGVRPAPKNETERQDQKAAELNHAVWQDIKEHHKINEKNRKWCEQFIQVGEHALKIFWDPYAGRFEGYEQAVDEVTGEPLFEQGTDELGNPILVPMDDESQPIMSGDLVYEKIHGFNLIRPVDCQDMEDAEWLMLRKMVPRKELASRYSDRPDISKALAKSSEQAFLVFDANRNDYTETKDQILIKELYYRPSYDYPEGYFYIFTEFGILEEGVLPYGIFPIVWVGFDEYVTNPRAKSIVDIARPFQAEVNRSATQEAMHQITLGDDKILYHQGSKLAQGALLPGVRGVSYTGMTPTILPGRSGGQFSDYNQRTKNELFMAVLLDEVNQEKQLQLDPHTLLYRTALQKATFKPYIDKWQGFLVAVAELSLKLTKHYISDNALIAAVGRSEQINIAEFRSTSPLSYSINLEPVSDDAETLLGKQINFQHILQYVGKNLSPDQMGRMLKNAPYVNNEDNFSDFTINEDNIRNDMLALERGEKPQISPSDDNAFYVRNLTKRTKEADFRYLAPGVQQAYFSFLQAHAAEEARKIQEIEKAKEGLIPTGGALVSVDMYVEDKENPENKPKRARVDQRAMEWLIERLEVQGDTLEKMADQETSSIAKIAEMVNSQGQMEMMQ